MFTPSIFSFYGVSVNCTAKKQLTKVPTGSGFVEKIDGVYKKSIDYNRAEYKTILQELGFDIDEEIPEIEDDENIIITLSAVINIYKPVI